MTDRLLFENITVITQSGTLKNAYVAVENGKFASVSGVRPEGFDGARIIDGQRRVMLPGLINMHTHIPMTLLRGYADGHDLQDWLYNYVFPVEDKLDGKCVYLASLLGMAEAIASGTTCINDMYFFSGDIAKAALSCGIKANLSRPLQNFGEPFDIKTDRRVNEFYAFHGEFNGAGDGQIRVDAALHAEYTSNSQVRRALADIAKKLGVPIHLHLSETKKEHDECVRRNGMTPAAVMLADGIFESHVNAAHCVAVTDGDIKILADNGVCAVHNPSSNLKLASGFAPVMKMAAAGVNITTGTDGVSSNNSHDMIQELKLAAMLRGAVSGEPTACCAPEILKTATVDAARALCRDDECGDIATGADADFAVLNFDRPGLFPCHDALSNVIFAANGGDVCMTCVRGRILYENGSFLTIDMEKVMNEIRNYAIPMLFGIK